MLERRVLFDAQRTLQHLLRIVLSEIDFDLQADALVKSGMSKLLPLVIVAMMVIQLIKPLGWPGLKRRSDFWKLAALAMAAISITAALGHWT
ncbi:hypothetical protein [Mesorhizobium sp.]|uniref:hypothetical protein n=1 Tax=Mesorhizobium sp. TaxID=1871066 RepID=UPI00257A1091|nr:hypothetical protein [Mesorhizobium sp.]